ncbi:hypothetical protein GW17_00025775 [Ensete ventricosum]|nr:hypothetical protein GW17_00025775 [Ensete ventricosum]
MIEGLLQSGLAKVKSMHRVDAFGNSSGVCRKLAEGIGSLPGWRKGVRQKKIETRRKIIGGLTMAGSMKLQPDDGPKYSLGTGPSSDDAVGSRQKFARRFVEGIGELAGNAKGDRREEDRRTCRKIAGGCRSMRDDRGRGRRRRAGDQRAVTVRRRPAGGDGRLARTARGIGTKSPHTFDIGDDPCKRTGQTQDQQEQPLGHQLQPRHRHCRSEAPTPTHPTALGPNELQKSRPLRRSPEPAPFLPRRASKESESKAECCETTGSEIGRKPPTQYCPRTLFDFLLVFAFPSPLVSSNPEKIPGYGLPPSDSGLEERLVTGD